jgi:hypothetical protein
MATSSTGLPHTIAIQHAAAIDRHTDYGRGAVYLGNNTAVHAFDLATGAELAGWPVTVPSIVSPAGLPFEKWSSGRHGFCAPARKSRQSGTSDRCCRK